MKLIKIWFGIFSIENENIVACDLYPRDVRTLAERLQETPRALEINEICGCDIRHLALKWKFVISEQEYDELFHSVNIEYTRQLVSAAKSDEQILIQSIEAMDDLDRIINVLSERLKELYDLNFPELKLKSEPLVHFVSRYGTRDNPDTWIVEDEDILRIAEHSMGIELPVSYAENIRELAVNISGLIENRNRLSEYIELYITGKLPNLSAIAGAHIGARLISIAGSVQKLTNMPSSTIQVLGAEKALFKHLKGNAPSPKHGVIFQHPAISGSSRWLRGKIARKLASSISIAIRVDYYSGDYRREIAESFNRKLEALHKQYPPKH
ncbi:MAG: rRNA biogenesis protein [Methanosarcinales archaeon]|nr:rRNA biogenesis protein [Methanosarcinales archaeon]